MFLQQALNPLYAMRLRRAWGLSRLLGRFFPLRPVDPRFQFLDLQLLGCERLALRADVTAPLLALLDPLAQSGIHQPQGLAGLGHGLPLIQSCSLALELDGKYRSLLAHQAPL